VVVVSIEEGTEEAIAEMGYQCAFTSLLIGKFDIAAIIP